MVRCILRQRTLQEKRYLPLLCDRTFAIQNLATILVGIIFATNR
ncbi:MAG: hypothetical protein RMX68_002445 [Aulosira sp. ZfuVER01]|nr:hypothetical protein [Aulosira sp. DedVER01a]MDZ8054471.1 hypothetical protein [Aulosira sp. ZfuCHP01]